MCVCVCVHGSLYPPPALSVTHSHPPPHLPLLPYSLILFPFPHSSPPIPLTTPYLTTPLHYLPQVLDLSKVKHFILDECDRLLAELDMRRDVQTIFMATPHEKQVRRLIAMPCCTILCLVMLCHAILCHDMTMLLIFILVYFNINRSNSKSHLNSNSNSNSI